MSALPRETLAGAVGDLAGWSIVDAKLYKKFEFTDFNEAWAFMSQVAAWAEQHNHHPEWLNVYNRVEVWLTTHDAGGVTEVDVNMARFMNHQASR